MELEVKLPIFGFENLKKVTLTKIDDFFYKLEFENAIAFTLLNPKKVRDYRIDIPNNLKKSNDEEIEVFVIVTILNPIEESTINFLAPIVVNIDDKTISQIVLDEKKYPEYGLKEPIKKYL